MLIDIEGHGVAYAVFFKDILVTKVRDILDPVLAAGRGPLVGVAHKDILHDRLLTGPNRRTS